MTMMIDFLDETGKVAPGEISQVEQLLQFAAGKMKVEEGSEVSVTFVDNERIHAINLEYRQKDAPTDVISFPMEEQGEGEIEISGADMPRILGDIIISIERAKEQAEEYGHTYARELGFLAVHGFLHLLGYDHESKEEETEMFSLQKEILEEFGLARE
ncbi:rRNA maturation RNase YbeY [Bacillus sp. FJAT-27225]|uniref:rRNA maturation RNase YbeY n=1 Tax=Bacillus sp. FJAT-27225 TaxID=1743144 RepID=UPI00080C3537|nr:rRNA maturation RNase YbeY [Bacillus sp. FJAT-27225]OCA91148.1 rRNA maturation RNase YbeY [Bacillus sp. FJAT-27225]